MRTSIDMGNSKIPARKRDCRDEVRVLEPTPRAHGRGREKNVHVPVVRVMTAPTSATDYTYLANKPKIEGEELIGDKALWEFGLGLATEEDIDALFD